MSRNLRWRIVIIVAVIGLSVLAFYPPSEKIRLGLDLRGGVHLVMRVQTQDALRVETETTVEQLREALRAENVQFTTLEMTSETEFRIEGIQDDAAFRREAIAPDTVYERSPIVGGYAYRMRPNMANQLREEAVEQALQTIERRVNELGVAEPVVARHGGDNQILVQLPGVDDVQRAKEIIRSTAFLEKKQVERSGFQSEEEAQQAYGGELPPDLQALPGEAGVWYVVRRTPVVTGRDLRTARQQLDQFNRPAVGFTLSQEGARKFGDYTSANIGRNLAIVLDDRVISAPVIEGRITDQGQITGNFTTQSAGELALQLRSGALPASLDYLEERTIGPSLGLDSIRAGVTASLTGLTLVVCFILFYYRLAGINAIVALVVNLVILLGLMAYLGATMTLPGIAGLILTIGMGVDSNVLIFERIKEELGTAKGVRAAVNAGFDRVWLTIVDTHVTSLVAAAFLFQFGTGPIRGFAMTLTIGLLANMFTSVFVSRTIFELLLTQRRGAPQPLSI